MSWDQDREHNINATTYGFPSMSTAFIPRSTARGIWHFFLMVLVIAGVLGASSELMQCSRVISQVIKDPRSHLAKIHRAHRKDR